MFKFIDSFSKSGICKEHFYEKKIMTLAAREEVENGKFFSFS